MADPASSEPTEETSEVRWPSLDSATRARSAGPPGFSRTLVATTFEFSAGNPEISMVVSISAQPTPTTVVRSSSGPRFT